MNIPHWLKIAVVSLIALQVGASFTHAQRHGVEPFVTTGTPPGLIKKVEPAYPMGFVIHGAKGRGVYRIVKSTGYRDLNELAAKALLQWRFKPGTPSPVEVPVEFDIQGGNRILH